MNQANRNVIDIAVPAFVGALAATVGTGAGRWVLNKVDQTLNWQPASCPRCGGVTRYHRDAKQVRCPLCGIGFRLS